MAVETNLQAFRRGRQAVADRAALEAAVTAAAGVSAPAALSRLAQRIAPIVAAEPRSELERLVRVRVGELVDYQDAAYARRYAARVEQVRAREAATVGGTALAEAVAVGLHKLMAYKDEYEVARLHLDSAAGAALRARYGADAQTRVMLHPPVLKALGVTRKIAIPGPVATAMFRALAPMKRLRHTRWDVFGRDHVRVVERALVAQYDALLEEILDTLDPQTLQVAVELAGLPDLVRGYDEVKLRNVQAYRKRVADLRPRLHAPHPGARGGRAMTPLPTPAPTPRGRRTRPTRRVGLGPGQHQGLPRDRGSPRGQHRSADRRLSSGRGQQQAPAPGRSAWPGPTARAQRGRHRAPAPRVVAVGGEHHGATPAPAFAWAIRRPGEE